MESGQVDTDDQGIRSGDSQGQLAIAPEAITKPNTHIIGGFYYDYWIRSDMDASEINCIKLRC